MAREVNMAEKTATSKIINGENGYSDAPSRNERMRSEPFVKGLIRANVTSGDRVIEASAGTSVNANGWTVESNCMIDSG